MVCAGRRSGDLSLEVNSVKYSKQNGIHIVEVPIDEFKIVMNDSTKKNVGKKNYCNAGFFATYHENKKPFTLPVAHLKCDYAATFSATKKYCTERGKFNGSKFTFDSSNWSYQNPCFNKAVSTLLVKDNSASIQDVVSIPANCNYAISGVPIMRDGQDIKFATYVKGQGWDASSLYATWHIFVGLKQETDNKIFVISMKTKTGNMITSGEAFKVFKSLGFYDVIKLDGGGSAYMKVNNTAVVATSENRRISNIITFEGTTITTINNNKTTEGCPYPEPTKVVKRSILYNKDALWVQWTLTRLGFDCGGVDGKFGKNTEATVKDFQEKKGLEPDGKVGPATRKVIKLLLQEIGIN